jgi:prepilin-type processing-associated H-X9-DG protein
MKRIAWWEAAAILVLLVVALQVLALPTLAKTSEARRRSLCQNNLKQMGLVCKMYSNESKGQSWPPRSPIRHNWSIDANAVYPEYLADLTVLACPSHPRFRADAFALRADREHPKASVGIAHPDCVSPLYYVYTGFSIGDDLDALAAFDTLSGGGTAPLPAQDLEVILPYGLHAFGTGGLGPVMWDRVPENIANMAHHALGGNVLFMDGHVEYIAYDHENPNNHFPMTRVSGQTFGGVWPQLSQDCWQPWNEAEFTR